LEQELSNDEFEIGPFWPSPREVAAIRATPTADFVGEPRPALRALRFRQLMTGITFSNVPASFGSASHNVNISNLGSFG